MNFNSDKILWVKNVKQVIEGDWAYDNKNDLNCNKPFQLHWSSRKGGRTSAGKANVGDIIVLFQRPDFIDGKPNKKVYLTHLVTPVTKDVSENEKFPKHKNCREIKLLAMANPINSIPASDEFIFRKVSQGGWTCKIEHLVSKKGLSKNAVKRKMVNLFSDYFCDKIVINKN